MFGSEVLDVAIGLVFLYLLLSLITSAIREGIEGWLKARASTLERGLRELLQDPQGTGILKDFYAHPLISGLYGGCYNPKRKRNLPSYIPSRNFAGALMDLAAQGSRVGAERAEASTARGLAQDMRQGAAQLPAPLQRVLLAALDTAQDDVVRVQEELESWFNSAMDRVSGWYRRRTLWWILGIGFLLTVAMNANTITVTKHLSDEKGRRETLIAAMHADSSILNLTPAQAREQLERLRLPIGWQGSGAPEPPKSSDWRSLTRAYAPYVAGSLLGWLLTTLAISLGAPFWFDVLNKIMVIRSTVKPREKSQEEGSEDRPAAASAVRPAAGSTASLQRFSTQQPPGFVPHEWVDGNPQEGVL